MPISNPQLLFHGSPYRNRYLISQQGLLVAKDARKKGRIWLASSLELPYVLDHVTGKDGLTLQFYAVFQVYRHLIPGGIKPCGRAGVYYTTKDIPQQACEWMYTYWSHLDAQDMWVAC